MARKAMVTRTLATTIVTVLLADLKNEAVVTNDIEVTGAFKLSDPKLLKAVEEKVEATEFKVIHLKSANVNEILLGMTEEEFIKHAIMLDPVTRKPIQADAAE